MSHERKIVLFLPCAYDDTSSSVTEESLQFEHVCIIALVLHFGSLEEIKGSFLQLSFFQLWWIEAGNSNEELLDLLRSTSRFHNWR